MFRRLVFLLALATAPSVSAAPPVSCDPSAIEDAAETARSNIIAGVDGAEALRAWQQVIDHGGAIAWRVTEYNVDARSAFVLTFDRSALRVYRAGALERDLDRAMAGCVDPGIEPEAVIPWQEVKEIE